MSIQLDHVIIWATDRAASSRFLADMRGSPVPITLGPFAMVEAAGVSLAFMSAPDLVTPQHYASLVGEAEFDATLGCVCERRLSLYADPYHHRPGEIQRDDGGRSVYVNDPDDHELEIITRCHGGSPAWATLRFRRTDPPLLFGCSRAGARAILPITRKGPGHGRFDDRV